MKWRLQEGQGEAIYEIGVEDNGAVVGLPEKELQASLKTLEVMASKLGATITVLRQQCIDTSDTSKHVAEVLIRQVPDDQQVSKNFAFCPHFHLYLISGLACTLLKTF